MPANPPSTSLTLDRRSFIKAGALAGGGLLLSAFIPNRLMAAPTAAADFSPNLFIRISPSGTITIVSMNPEIGQGIKTSLPMIVAEELEAPWDQVIVEQAGLQPELGAQFAGGSSATPSQYDRMRRFGATGRALLEAAAAQIWKVPATECRAHQGQVKHEASGRSLSFGELASTAATLPIPAIESVTLKDPKDFKLLGRRIGGVDNRAIVTGQPLFGIDQRPEGLLHAVYVRCPASGGKVRSANLEALKRLPGVKEAFVLEGDGDPYNLLPGVAIVAIDTWTAFKAMQSLQVLWDEGETGDHHSMLYQQRAEQLAQQDGQEIRAAGDVATALSSAARTLEAVYDYPFLSHTNLEPQNTTALFKDGTMEIWSPTQAPGGGRDGVAKALGIDKEKIVIHMMRIGGGFGRRLMSDFMVEAAAIAQRMEGTPIKVSWTREQDMRHDYYRPAGWHFLKAGLDNDGKPVAWDNHFITFGFNSDQNPGHGADVGGNELPADFIPNYRLRRSIISTRVPMGWWRAPGSCAYAFAFQSFIDEMAIAGGRDPVEFRIELLGEDRLIGSASQWSRPYDTARMKAVVKHVAQAANWGQQMPRGRGQGIAFHYSHFGYVAIVAEVSVSTQGSLKVEKMTASVDVGPIVNLSGAENQVQGSMLDGLSAAWLQGLTVENARIRQSNFEDSPLLRMQDAPRMEVHFLKTDHPPTGLGEPALPPAAPAVCNAIFAATGRRIRSLPIANQDLSWS